MRRKDESKVIQATQHTHGSPYSKEKELPRVGFEPTTFRTLDMYMYIYICVLEEEKILFSISS